ncbi:MAG: hypothetical protein JWN48_2938 [Myxococcaceae bacterium]|nr:hypothetical protein [Myxococcaceae bacterium]
MSGDARLYGADQLAGARIRSISESGGREPVNTRHRNFVEPPWQAALELPAVLRAIPESATISGMFMEPLAEHARRLGKPLPSARERYVPFRFYPLREHAQLLSEMCTKHYGAMPLRQALRKLGRAAPSALAASTIGKVMLSTANGVEDMIRALIKTYPLNLRPGKLDVIEFGPNSVTVRLEEVYYFLDSHHVGSFEGIMRFAGKEGTVRICSYSSTSADFLCTWAD